MEYTAVEWLIQRLEHLIPNHYYPVIEQAKEFEKEQIIDAYETSHISMMTSEQYYNEKFKK